MPNPQPSTLEAARAFCAAVMDRYSPASWTWHYETGLLLGAVLRWAERADDDDARAYVLASANALVSPAGIIAGYRLEEYNLDQVNTGKLLLALHAACGDSRYGIAAGTLRSQLAAQPRTRSGSWWHKLIYPSQVWLDGLYMAAPFAVRWGLEAGDQDFVDDACAQLLAAERHTRNPATGLLHHAWDETRAQLWSDPSSGRSPHSWGRALGWYCMAVADVWELLPPSHPQRRHLAELAARLAALLAERRDAESGFWLQVLDQPSRPGNYPETSASAMFCYFLAKGARTGLLADPAAARSLAADAFAALSAARVSPLPGGRASLSGICKVAGLGGDPYRDGSFAYYIGEPVVADDPKGVGPYILAALELE